MATAIIVSIVLVRSDETSISGCRRTRATRCITRTQRWMLGEMNWPKSSVDRNEYCQLYSRVHSRRTELHQVDPVTRRVIGHARQHHEVDWPQGCRARTTVQFSSSVCCEHGFSLPDDDRQFITPSGVRLCRSKLTHCCDDRHAVS